VDEEKRGDVYRAAMLVALTAAVAWAVGYGFDPGRAGRPAALLGLGAMYAALTACGLAYAYHESKLKKWLVPASGDLTRGFVAALVLFGCAFGLVKLLTMHGSPRAAWMAHIYLQLGDPTPLRKHQAWVGLVITLAAAMEEIVWRGWAQSMLEDLVGARAGWVAAAALYSLAHVPTVWALSDPTAGRNPMVMIAALGAGLVFGALVRAFGRLWPSIVCHALFDFAVLVMFRLWGPSI
jgi:membrane protease YdiL (CAAX protease family)